MDGYPVDYQKWISGMLDYIMVPSNSTYGRELEELVVLAPEGQSAPQTKPPYLRQTRYVTRAHLKIPDRDRRRSFGRRQGARPIANCLIG